MRTQQNPKIYNELIDLIARSNPRRVLDFRLSQKTAKRVESLVEREKNDRIQPDEQDELDTYMQLSRIIMLAQAEAYRILHGTPNAKRA